MNITLPDAAITYGFYNAPVGTHGSRTIMLKELSRLFEMCPRSAGYDQYREAIVTDNALLKNTETTRRESFRRLRELYGLDESILLFRGLRDLWDHDEDARPLLALLCAVARDSIFRSTAAVIVASAPGTQVTPQMIEDAVKESFPQRYNPMMLANIGRHAASSWQQSGHLQGRTRKTRSLALCTPVATAYALWLGWLCGARGDGLFATLWRQLLDASTHALHEQAAVASKLGLLEYRHTGSVTEISFHYLLRSPIPTTDEKGAQ